MFKKIFSGLLLLLPLALMPNKSYAFRCFPRNYTFFYTSAGAYVGQQPGLVNHFKNLFYTFNGVLYKYSKTQFFGCGGKNETYIQAGSPPPPSSLPPIKRNFFRTVYNDVYLNFINQYSSAGGFYQTTSPVTGVTYGAGVQVSSSTATTKKVITNARGRVVDEFFHVRTIVDDYTQNTLPTLYATVNQSATNTIYDNFLNGVSSSGGYSQSASPISGATYGPVQTTKSSTSTNSQSVANFQLTITTTILTTTTNNYFQQQVISSGLASVNLGNSTSPQIGTISPASSVGIDNVILPKSTTTPVNFTVPVDSTASAYNKNTNAVNSQATITYNNVPKTICENFIAKEVKLPNINNIFVNQIMFFNSSEKNYVGTNPSAPYNSSKNSTALTSCSGNQNNISISYNLK